MLEKQKERLEELFRLIKENPDLPILPMVDSDGELGKCLCRRILYHQRRERSF